MKYGRKEIIFDFLRIFATSFGTSNQKKNGHRADTRSLSRRALTLWCGWFGTIIIQITLYVCPRLLDCV